VAWTNEVEEKGNVDFHRAHEGALYVGRRFY